MSNFPVPEAGHRQVPKQIVEDNTCGVQAERGGVLYMPRVHLQWEVLAFKCSVSIQVAGGG